MKNKFNSKTNWYFILTIGLYFLFRQLSSSFDWKGVMYAEAATEYFHFAKNGTFYERFLDPDAGYIPLIARVFAYLVHLLGVKNSQIPYFYTYVSMAISALLVSVFNLKRFRILIENDILRFYLSLFILIVIDFETESFINFSIFCSWFIFINVLVAVIKKDSIPPFYTYLIPVMMVTKPHVLALLPVIILSTFFVNKKYRTIFLFAILFSFIQITQLANSSINIAMPVYQISNYTFSDKLIASLVYFVSYLGMMFSPLFGRIPFYYSTIFGIIILLLSLVVVIKTNKYSVIVFMGLCTIFFVFIINTFGIPTLWNLNEFRFLQNIDRWVFVAFVGYIFILYSIVITFKLHTNKSLFFTLFFLLNCWVIKGVFNDRERNYTIFVLAKKALTSVEKIIPAEAQNYLIPIIEKANKRLEKEPISSQWNVLANDMDKEKKCTVCIPIESYPWIYGENCKYIQTIIPEGGKYIKVKANEFIKIELPAGINKENVSSIAPIIKVEDSSKLLNLSAIITTKDKQKFILKNRQTKIESARHILLINNEIQEIKGISSLFIKSDKPFEIYVEPNKINPTVSWIGYIK